LGQETTGAAGFAMAMRSIPAILDYARLAAEVSAPNAWMYNFTNPAGLVAQALHYAGIQCVVGICDSANGAQHAVSRYMDVPLARVRHTVYGLNHLSWTRSTTVDGEEVLPALLRDDAFVNSTHMPMFARGLRLWQGAFLNEYLHYYYHRDEALAALLAKRETRGEEVMRLTNELLKKLRTVAENERLAVYHDVMGRRSATYMAHARNGVPREPRISEDDEGYTGVALGCMQAMATNTTHYTGLNVPNNDTIAGLREDDVVEVSCIIENGQISPVAVSDIPDHQFALMLVVKQYERMAARAILACSREGAVEALAIHPLIGSYPLAQTLVNEFLAAHQDLIGTWN
jgi:6-phospho-beta-glucosidase